MNRISTPTAQPCHLAPACSITPFLPGTGGRVSNAACVVVVVAFLLLLTSLLLLLEVLPRPSGTTLYEKKQWPNRCWLFIAMFFGCMVIGNFKATMIDMKSFPGVVMFPCVCLACVIDN